MLTARATRLRDWLLFAIAALAPAALTLALGLRAVSNEEAATLREAARSFDAAGERLSLAILQAISGGSDRLRTLAIDASPERAAEALRTIAPDFSEPVVFGTNGALVWPPAPTAASHVVPAKCSALAEELRPARPTESRASARAGILATCREARTATGRWLWPVVALEGLVPADANAFAVWIDEHATMLGSAEREATAIDVAAASALDESTKARVLRALAAPVSRREALSTELRAPRASAALQGPVGDAGLVTWHAGGSVGVLRRLDDGRLAGFVVHRATLAETIAAGKLGILPEHRAEVITGPTAAAAPTAGELWAAARVTPELGVRLLPSDPGATLRRASRSRALLTAIAAIATALAFGVAAVLFARMRAAKRSSELRTDFVSAVSHELRTPIASMRMLAELLDEERIEPGERAEVHRALVKEARRLGETVDRLLGFGRMAAGREVLARERVNVGSAVASSIDTFEDRHPELPKVVRVIDGAIESPIDAGQIRLAVDNLLENAKKYAPAGGPYRVAVRREGAQIAIAVEDDGPGIAKRDQKRIFRPFERADDRLNSATEGSGIGLSLVDHVARAHGGRVVVESEPSRGARFTILIPRGTT